MKKRISFRVLGALFLALSILLVIKGASEAEFGGLIVLCIVCLLLSSTTPKPDTPSEIEQIANIEKVHRSEETLLLRVSATCVAVILTVIIAIAICCFIFIPKITATVLIVAAVGFLSAWLFDKKSFQEAGVVIRRK
jgi:hypothetical protein